MFSAFKNVEGKERITYLPYGKLPTPSAPGGLDSANSTNVIAIPATLAETWRRGYHVTRNDAASGRHRSDHADRILVRDRVLLREDGETGKRSGALWRAPGNAAGRGVYIWEREEMECAFDRKVTGDDPISLRKVSRFRRKAATPHGVAGRETGERWGGAT